MRALLLSATLLVTTLLAATQQAAWADTGSTVSVKPSVVEVGLNFAGADIHIDGTAPEDTQVVLKVDGPTESVKLNKKGKVLGLFWMTIDQAEVEDMPAFHVVQSSKPIEHLLSIEQQVKLGVDPESSNILDQARAVDPNNESPLSGEKQTEFVTALRDMYITEGQYTPWRCYHEAEAADCDTTAPTGAIIRPDNEGHWETSVSLPSDAALGEYSVQAHYVKDGEIVRSDATTFSVEKAGLADSLSSMAAKNGAEYGAMCLGIIIVAALAIGMIFPRPRGRR
jgi:hypothetical protein